MRTVTILGGLLVLSLAGCGEEPPKFQGPMTLGGEQISAEILNRGHRTYVNFCASCHGADGSGRGPAAQGLRAAPRDFREGLFKIASGSARPSDEQLLRVVREGRPDAGMPPFPHLLPEDREAVVHYLKTFSPRWTSPPAATP